MRTADGWRKVRLGSLLAVGLLHLSPGLLSAQTVIDTIPVGNNPRAIAVNEVTNKIYVANCPFSLPWTQTPGTVTVIDGDTDVTTDIPVGVCPVAIAVNPVTNRIYVANHGQSSIQCSHCSHGDITVIDGASNTALTVADPHAQFPNAIAVNSISNRIYVGNLSGNVSVIDGSDNSLTSISAGTLFVTDVAVNSATNKIYVATSSGAHDVYSVVIIDGATNTWTAVTDPAGPGPDALAVNPLTNKVYVANFGGDTNQGSSTVIDGTTGAVINIADRSVEWPYAVVVNPQLNRVYVANHDNVSLGTNGGVTVINGLTNGFITIRDPKATTEQNWPKSMSVDLKMNRVYVANAVTHNITVIDGVTYLITNIADPNAAFPVAVAVNTVTGKIYVANRTSNNVTVIDGTTHVGPLAHPCSTIRPGPDWVCVNGNWLKPTYPAKTITGAAACSTIRPAANWTCVNGNWLPPWYPIAGSGGNTGGGSGGTTGGGSTGGTGGSTCTTIKPAANWTCVNGNWLPPWYPVSGGSTGGGTTGSGGSGTTTCTTIKPAANWTCVNGNWLPPWYPTLPQ